MVQEPPHALAASPLCKRCSDHDATVPQTPPQIRRRLSRNASTSSMWSEDDPLDLIPDPEWSQEEETLLWEMYQDFTDPGLLSDVPLTPFDKAHPPSNFTQRVSKEAIRAWGGAQQWRHSIRATRMHILKIAHEKARQNMSPSTDDKIVSRILIPSPLFMRRLSAFSTPQSMRKMGLADPFTEPSSSDKISSPLDRYTTSAALKRKRSSLGLHSYDSGMQDIVVRKARIMKLERRNAVTAKSAPMPRSIDESAISGQDFTLSRQCSTDASLFRYPSTPKKLGSQSDSESRPRLGLTIPPTHTEQLPFPALASPFEEKPTFRYT